MNTAGVTHDELRQMVELSMEDKPDEARDLMADIVMRDKMAFDRAIQREMRAVREMNRRNTERLSKLAMVAGLFAGMATAGWIIAFGWYFAGIVPHVVPSAAVFFACALCGGMLGRFWAK